MPFVVVDLKQETLADGSHHIYSPNVPGFHVVDPNQDAAIEYAMPVLHNTLRDRLIEAGFSCDVRFIDRGSEIRQFCPDELRQHLGAERVRTMPNRIIVEIP